MTRTRLRTNLKPEVHLQRLSILWPAAIALVLAFPLTSDAGLCGDDVGGVRVACACGDFVVSDTVLSATDPVVNERCATDGLIIQASENVDSLRLDLAGQSISGSGVGVGILVSFGGSDGARISGGPEPARPGQVVGFGSGLRVRSQRTLAAVSNIDFRGHTNDGAALRSLDTKLENVRAFANGRDGLRLGGRKLAIDGVEAEGNGRRQIDLQTNSTAQAGADAGLSAGVHARKRLPVRREPSPIAGSKPSPTPRSDAPEKEGR